MGGEALLLGALRHMKSGSETSTTGGQGRLLLLAVWYAALGGLAPILSKFAVVAAQATVAAMAASGCSSVHGPALAMAAMFGWSYLSCPLHGVGRRRRQRRSWARLDLVSDFRDLALLSPGQRHLVLFSSLLVAIIGPLLFLLALASLEPHVLAILLLTTSPIAVLLSCTLLGESLGWRQAVGSLLVLAGVGLVLASAAVEADGAPEAWGRFTRSLHGPAVLLALAAAVCYGSQRVLTKALLRPRPTGESSCCDPRALRTSLLRCQYGFGSAFAAAVFVPTLFSRKAAVLGALGCIVKLGGASLAAALLNVTRWRLLYFLQSTNLDQLRLEPIAATSVLWTLFFSVLWRASLGGRTAACPGWLWYCAGAAVAGAALASGRPAVPRPNGKDGPDTRRPTGTEKCTPTAEVT